MLRVERVVGSPPLVYLVGQTALDVVARAALADVGALIGGQVVGREGEHLRLVDAVVFVERKRPLGHVALLLVPSRNLHQCKVREVVPVNVYQSDFHKVTIL